jgi:hypothetical protein
VAGLLGREVEMGEPAPERGEIDDERNGDPQ